MKLYEYDIAIEACIDPETGEVDEAQMSALVMEKQEKIEGMLLYAKELEATAKAIGDEQKALGERKEKATRTAENIRNYVQQALAGEKFSTPRVSVTYRRSSAVVVPDVWLIPEEYRKYSTPTADKVKIKDALKLGEEVEGAYLEEHTSMIVK